MQYDALCVDAFSYAARLASLAVVPLLASLARWTDVVALAAEPGFSGGLKLGHPLADLWTFVDAPKRGGQPLAVDAPIAIVAELSAELVAGFVVFVVGTGLLMAGYVGSIDQFVRRGRYDFLENVGRYGVRMVWIQAIVFTAVLVVVALAPFGLIPVIVAIVFGLLAWILFYLAPFLVVVEDRPLDAAFRRSLELVANRIEALAFLAIYAGLVLLMSIPLSIAVNADLPGVLVASLAASGFGLYLTVLTVLFARELVGAGGPTEESSSTGPGPDADRGDDRDAVADGG